MRVCNYRVIVFFALSWVIKNEGVNIYFNFEYWVSNTSRLVSLRSKKRSAS